LENEEGETLMITCLQIEGIKWDQFSDPFYRYWLPAGKDGPFFLLSVRLTGEVFYSNEYTG
jgi:hypothetical protein